MTESKIKDIISTMIECNFIDAKRAMMDKEYLKERFLQYVQAANIARSMLNMKPLI